MIDQKKLIEMRSKQEEVAQIIDGGYYKTFVELQGNLFDEYVKRGFTREEALEVILVMIQHNQWNLSPHFNEGSSNEITEE